MGLLHIVTEPSEMSKLVSGTSTLSSSSDGIEIPSQSLCRKFQELHERNPDQLNPHFEVVVNQK